VELPSPATRAVELRADDLPAVLGRAAAEGVAPDDRDQLLRYLTYLGAAYLEAERIVERAPSIRAAYDELHRRFGAAGAGASVLRFHWAEAARNFAAEGRAAAAHDRFAGTYQAVVEKMEREIATREERIRHLERALGP
jgi:hypothetical protein